MLPRNFGKSIERLVHGSPGELTGKPRKIFLESESLSGKLAERAAAKGAQKIATTAMHDAVSEQKQVWGACYRLLAAVGSEDARVAQLLTDAARKRSTTKKKR